MPVAPPCELNSGRLTVSTKAKPSITVTRRPNPNAHTEATRPQGRAREARQGGRRGRREEESGAK